MKSNNILLITTDKSNIEGIREALIEHEVLTTDNFDEATSICVEHDIYLVIVEEELPGQSGSRLFVDLRRSRPWMAGILLTETADEKLLRRALDIGFAGLLEKPVEPVELLNRIYRTMESARSQEENIRLRTLLPLYSFGEQFLASTSEQQVFDGLVDIVVKETGATRVSVMWYKEEEGCLRIVAAKGRFPSSRGTRSQDGSFRRVDRLF